MFLMTHMLSICLIARIICNAETPKGQKNKKTGRIKRMEEQKEEVAIALISKIY